MSLGTQTWGHQPVQSLCTLRVEYELVCVTVTSAQSEEDEGGVTETEMHRDSDCGDCPQTSGACQLNCKRM